MNGERCRHCRTGKACRPRGLCCPCFATPSIRAQYPVAVTDRNRRGVEDFCGKAGLPPEPTEALPGSAEKIAVLAARAELRQSLWHPLDAPTRRHLK